MRFFFFKLGKASKILFLERIKHTFQKTFQKCLFYPRKVKRKGKRYLSKLFGKDNTTKMKGNTE